MRLLVRACASRLPLYLAVEVAGRADVHAMSMPRGEETGEDMPRMASGRRSGAIASYWQYDWRLCSGNPCTLRHDGLTACMHVPYSGHCSKNDPARDTGPEANQRDNRATSERR